MNVFAIAGSLRASSSNVALVQAIAELAPSGITVTTFNALGELPLFSPDVDTSEPPPVVARFREQITNADAILICTPEYAYGMPGSLKNALDWLVSSASLYKKPVAAMSASPSPRGGDRALAWLLQTLTALDANVPESASFPISIIRNEIDVTRLMTTELGKRFSTMFAALEAASYSRKDIDRIRSTN